MPLPIAWPRWRAVRNVDAGRYLEGFLVAAVAAVLVIRFFLELTGYPQLGGHGLHIAHMLWGGLLMLAALVLMLAFLGKHVQHLAAIVAGIGFGTFIDELGKFITSDNDYFFQPTMALIYATFVLLFLAFRAIEPRELFSEQERLVNAIDLLKEAIIAGDAGAQRERALDLLGPSAGASPLVPVLRAAIERAPLAAPAPTRTRDVHQAMRALYVRLVSRPWFRHALVAIFVLHAIGAVASLAALIVTDHEFTLSNPAMSLADWGDTVGTVLSSAMIVVGVAALRGSRLAAYHWFKRAVLVSIFLIQFFAFYTEQLGALVGLTLDLVLLGGLNYLIEQEETARWQGPAGPLAAPSATSASPTPVGATPDRASD